jgi:hypothetical protein
MWDLLRTKKNQEECRRLGDALGATAEIRALSSSQREHLAACPDCQAAADDILMSRTILREVPARAALPGPWFAPRVMAAIAARESELRQSLEAWAAVPRLAARLTFASAVVLLLASTWLYERPKPVPTSAANQSVVESLFDSPPYAGPQDDLAMPLEKAQ